MNQKTIPSSLDKKPQAEPQIKLGKYQHYKGNAYEVVGLVIHTETNEVLVLYKALYELDDDKKRLNTPVLFARPYKMFFDTVIVGEKQVPRFKFIEETNGLPVLRA